MKMNTQPTNRLVVLPFIVLVLAAICFGVAIGSYSLLTRALLSCVGIFLTYFHAYVKGFEAAITSISNEFREVQKAFEQKAKIDALYNSTESVDPTLPKA